MLQCWPRTSARIPELPQGYFNWISAVWKIPDTYVLTHESLDSYLFLRFLKLTAITCILGCPLIWLVLLPVNAVHGNRLTQLDRITTTNISNPARYWAHALIAWLYFGNYYLLKFPILNLLHSKSMILPKNHSLIREKTYSWWTRMEWLDYLP